MDDPYLRIIKREFEIEYEERCLEDVYRWRKRLQLVFRPNQVVHTYAKWEFVEESSHLTMAWDGGERQARDLFTKRVLELRSLERTTKAAGLFATSRFTQGAFNVDA